MPKNLRHLHPLRTFKAPLFDTVLRCKVHEMLVASGKMSAREFHDRVLRGNRIPVEMVRAEVSDVPLTRDYTTNWRFAEQFRPE